MSVADPVSSTVHFIHICPLMGFIKLGANQYWWAGRGGVVGGGILHFKTIISPPVCSAFIHKVHPLVAGVCAQWLTHLSPNKMLRRHLRQ